MACTTGIQRREPILGIGSGKGIGEIWSLTGVIDEEEVAEGTICKQIQECLII